MRTATHSIGKVSFHLKGVKTEKVFAQRQQIAGYLQNHFAAMAEEVLNEVSSAHELIYISKVKIDLHESFGELNSYRLNEAIRQELRKQLQLHQQEQVNAPSTTVIQTDSTGLTAAFSETSFFFWQQVWRFYLENGYLPPYMGYVLWQQRLYYFQQLFTSEPEPLSNYFITVLKKPHSLRRFLWNETKEMQSFVFHAIHPQLELVYEQLFRISMKQSGMEQLHHHLHRLFNSSLAEKIRTQSRIQELTGENDRIPFVSAEAIDEKGELITEDSAIPEENSLFVSNAGLVLLQPFLPQLFSTLKITDEERKLLLQPAKACTILSFLAGDEEPDEIKYPLYKVLCGLPPHAFVPVQKEMTKAERKECDSLLQSVIEHWTVLKQVSTASLQQTFFQRNGKLSFSNDRWLLQVEQKTEDVLLQFLPWSYSIIRYPWMHKPLFTEWT
jgi:hypothetical protein